MKMRSYKNSFIRLFLYGAIAFSMSAWLVSIGLILTLTKLTLGDKIILLFMPLLAGVLFGALWGALVSISYQGTSLKLSFYNEESFINSMNLILKKMKYNLDNSTGIDLIYKPSKRIDFFVGKIYINLQDNNATLIGSKICLKKINKILSQKHT